VNINRGLFEIIAAVVSGEDEILSDTERLPSLPKYNLVRQKIKTVFNTWLQTSQLHGNQCTGTAGQTPGMLQV
jgi:hypothetical protein